MAQIV